jgi:hypothetical protein
MPTVPARTIRRWEFPAWQPQLEDALLEFDPRKLPPLVEAAATAIFVRLQSQEAKPGELRALDNALRSLRRHSVQETEPTRLREARSKC